MESFAVYRISNAGQFCFICIESAAIVQSIRREIFHGSLKIHEKCEAFVVYGITIV